MSNLQQFPRFKSAENFATNNTLLLLNRIYKLDPKFFESLLNRLMDSDDIAIGPTFAQQRSSKTNRAVGIPDGILAQSSFKLVVETKLTDRSFWGKEEYSSHFQNERTRILFTISRNGMAELRKKEVMQTLKKYDEETKSTGTTAHKDQTFRGLISEIRLTITGTRTRYKVELEDLVDDFESFAFEEGLLSDEHLRMHVFAINNSEEDNKKYVLYYNYAHLNESPHRFVGLYRNKAIKYIAETKVIVIPVKKSDSTFSYTFLKGEQFWNEQRKRQLHEFLDHEGLGDDGKLKFHLFDKLYSTDFIKESNGGIMGPRHFYLTQHIERFPDEFDAAWLAEKLNGKSWQ